MATTLVMPQMGYDMQEGRVVRWLKKEGDPVRRGEPLAEIETDKAVVEMEAYASGVLRRILVAEGTTVPVGQAIGVIAAPEEPLPESPAQAPRPPSDKSPATQATKEGRAESPTPPPQAPPPPPGEVKASPLARRLAQEKGVDLAQVQGTGPGGRITERDIQTYEKALKVSPPAPRVAAAEEQPPQVIELSRMRRAIARLTSHSKREIPHFYVGAAVDMTSAMEFRSQLNKTLEGQGVRVSVNDLIVKAGAQALAKYPSFNSSFKEDKLVIHSAINIGIAIALDGEQGLIVPALLDCGARSLVDIARASKDLAERANTGHLKEAEYTGATFSVSNLGMYDIDSFVAIIHPPQSAVLAVGAIRKQPVVRGDQVTIAQVMQSTLSVDHRVNDGAGAARFLGEIKRLLENPVGLLL